jgi:hypothetical protein
MNSRHHTRRGTRAREKRTLPKAASTPGVSAREPSGDQLLQARRARPTAKRYVPSARVDRKLAWTAANIHDVQVDAEPAFDPRSPRTPALASVERHKKCKTLRTSPPPPIVSNPAAVKRTASERSMSGQKQQSQADYLQEEAAARIERMKRDAAESTARLQRELASAEANRVRERTKRGQEQWASFETQLVEVTADESTWPRELHVDALSRSQIAVAQGTIDALFADRSDVCVRLVRSDLTPDQAFFRFSKNAPAAEGSCCIQ